MVIAWLGYRPLVCPGDPHQDAAHIVRMYEVVVYQVLLGATLGVMIGYAAMKLLRWAHDRQ